MPSVRQYTLPIGDPLTQYILDTRYVAKFDVEEENTTTLVRVHFDFSYFFNLEYPDVIKCGPIDMDKENTLRVKFKDNVIRYYKRINLSESRKRERITAMYSRK
jgi:hypothetical protein